MDGPPSRPLDTGQAKGSKSQSGRHDRGAKQERREHLHSDSRDVESSGFEASEASPGGYSGERRPGDHRNRESDGSRRNQESDTGRGWDNGERRHLTEDSSRQLDNGRKRSGDSEGRRSAESESKRRAAALEPAPDSGVGSKSEGLRSSFESDSSARSVDYSRRSLESDGGSRRSVESPDSHSHRPVFSPPPPLPPQAHSPSDRQPEPAHSRHGAKKKRAAPRAVISSSQPEQIEPTDLALPAGKRDMTPSPRERFSSGIRREAAGFSRENFSGVGRNEAVASLKGGTPATTSGYVSSSPISTSTIITPAPTSSLRRAPSPPQGPSSSTSPVSPLPDSSPYSGIPHLSERPGQHQHHRHAPYRENPSWRPHVEEYPSSRSYSPVQGEDSRAGRHVTTRTTSSSFPPSPPTSSSRLDEATLLRHLKSSSRVPGEGPPPRLSGGDAEADRDGGEDGRESRRMSDGSRSPFSPLDARIDGVNSSKFFSSLFFLSFFVIIIIIVIITTFANRTTSLIVMSLITCSKSNATNSVIVYRLKHDFFKALFYHQVLTMCFF